MQRRFSLRHKADFDRMRQQGRSYHHRFMILNLLANGQVDNRYGFIVSRQVGGAVSRNRVRRLLREAMRFLHPQLKAGFDVVIVARRDLAGQPLQVVVRTIEELMIRAKLVKVGSDPS